MTTFYTYPEQARLMAEIIPKTVLAPNCPHDDLFRGSFNISNKTWPQVIDLAFRVKSDAGQSRDQAD